MKKEDIFARLKKRSDKQSKLSPKKKKLITLIVLPVVIALTVGITYLCGGFETIDYFLFYRHYTIDPTVISDGSFPVTFTGSDIISADNISSKAVILTKKLLTCISYKGRVLYTESFSFVEPQMKTDGKYGVVFDRGSDKFLIFDAYGIVYNGTVDGGRNIITADVDSKGNVVLSTKSDDSACRVYMVDKKGEIKFIWSCAENYVVSMDISKDSQKIACGAIGAVDNEILTNIYILDINSDSAASVLEVRNAACVDIDYLASEGDKVVLTCLNKRLIFNVSDNGTLDKNPLVAEFNGSSVLIDSDSLGNTAVLTEKYNSSDNNELTLYDKDSSIVFRCSTPSDVISLLCEGDKVYCLTPDKIITYTTNSEEKSEYICDMFGEGLIEIKGKIRYFSSKTIKNGF